MKRPSPSSFTLVEILLALAILGIGLVSILSVFVVGTNSVRRTFAMTEASFLAQMVIADYRSKGYDKVHSEEIEQICNSNGVPIYTNYSYIANVKDNPDVKDLKEINLTIQYKEKDILYFKTYIAKYEP